MARTVFTVDGEERTWADVVDAAKAWGDWARVERRCTAQTDQQHSVAPVRDEVERRATTFRREHRLLSVDETAEWFAQWGLSVAEWLAHVRQQVLGENPLRLDDAVWIEAVVSGMLEDAARRLASALAAHRSVGGTGRPTMSELAAPMDEVARRAVTQDRVAALIAANRLAWTTVELQQVDVADEGAARELAYGVHEDQRPIQELAHEAGAEVEHSRAALGEQTGELGALLMGAAPGDLVGPVLVDRVWRVAVVMSRSEPDQADPASVARARDELAEAALRREVNSRVHWIWSPR